MTEAEQLRQERDTIIRIIVETRAEISGTGPNGGGPACCMRTLRLLVRDIGIAVPSVAPLLARRKPTGAP